MVMARYEAVKFNGKNDLGLWRLKMKALLIHQGLAEALEPDVSVDKPDAKKLELMRRAHNAIILSLDDKVLREVAREETVAAMWKKLEELYMTKSLANKLYFKQRLYSFKFNDDRAVGERLDQLNKMIDDLGNIDAKMDDEDKIIALLNALPKSFEQLKDAMLYGQQKEITLVEVQSTLITKDLQRSSNVQEGANEKASLANSSSKNRKRRMKRKRPDHVTIARCPDT